MVAQFRFDVFDLLSPLRHYLEPPDLYQAEKWEATFTDLLSSRGGRLVFAWAALLVYSTSQNSNSICRFYPEGIQRLFTGLTG